MSTKIATPAAATKLIACAEKYGMTAKVILHNEHHYHLAITRQMDGKTAEMTFEWMVKNIAPVNSRLGFHTEYEPGVRFDYATGYTLAMDRERGFRWDYRFTRSIREGKHMIGLPV